VSLIRSKAGEWGIDSARIGIVGFSAGGHLAVATATRFEKRTYDSIDDVDRISCRPDFAISVYPGYLASKEKDELVRVGASRQIRPQSFSHMATMISSVHRRTAL
jgi:acetyl esterase/lipase